MSVSALYRRVFFICITVSAFIAIWYYISPIFGHQAPQKTIVATVVSPQPRLTEFNLTSTLGKPFNTTSLRGFWTVLFFGYTDCPDICPATLSIMRETWNQYLPKKQPPAKFVFASINPQLDAIPKLRTFFSKFS